MFQREQAGKGEGGRESESQRQDDESALSHVYVLKRQ